LACGAAHAFSKLSESGIPPGIRNPANQEPSQNENEKNVDSVHGGSGAVCGRRERCFRRFGRWGDGSPEKAGAVVSKLAAGAGKVNATVVPEPAIAIIGVVGVMLLLRRRPVGCA